MLPRFAVVCLAAISAALSQDAVSRRYVEGEHLRYLLKTVNNGMPYEAQAEGIVKKDADGNFFEEYSWSNVIYNGKPIELPQSSIDFRQRITLDPKQPTKIPDLSKVHSSLIGPITDFMTFYVDLGLAIRAGLKHPSDHTYRKYGTPASWADGTYVTLGESSIDFDVTLKSIEKGVAVLEIKHVPPQQPQVHLPAPWMREPSADTPNNWVEVSHRGAKYHAAVGKEIFDVEITSSVEDGKILSAKMTNPVKTRVRDCNDATLSDCSEVRSQDILRQVEIALIPK